MVKKRFYKLLCIVLAVVTVFSSALSVSAAVIDDNDEPGIMPMYTTIGTASCAVSISGITASCRASLSSKTSTSLKIKMELQKKKSSGYSTVETWTGSRTGTTLAVSGSRTINVLSTYRVKVTFTAGSETTVVYDYA